MKYLTHVFILLLTSLVYGDATQSAVELGNQVNSSVGDQEGISNKMSAPLSTEQQLSSFDGKSSFDAQLSCPGSSSFLKTTIQPLPSGDVGILEVQQDTTMDGSIDTVTNGFGHMSGICANGFIQCQPGTWDDCQSFEWTTNQDMSIAINPVPLSDLGGCYCVNNSCGNNLSWSNLPNVLRDVSGGMSGALASRNAFFTISDTEVTDTSITLFGQDSGGCAGESPAIVAQKSASDMMSLASEPNKIKQKAYSQAATDEMFQAIKTSELNDPQGTITQSCEVKRNVQVDEASLTDIIGYQSGTGGVKPCGPDCLELTLGKVGDNYWSGSCRMFEREVSFYVKEPDRIQKAELVVAKFDDWIQVSADDQYIWSGPYNNWTGTGRPPGKCELSTNWYKKPKADFTSLIQKEGQVRFKIRVEVTGKGEGYALARLKVNTSCKLAPETISNGCAVFESDPTCQLLSETVDGVDVVKNFSPTGVAPLSSTRTISGSSCSFEVNRPWWKKDRTYVCNKAERFDFTDALERADYIEENSTSQEFADQRIEDGQFTTSTGELNIKDHRPISQCQNVCKTKKEAYQDEVTVSGVTGSSVKNPMTYDFFYYTCTTDNTCPAGDGEEIIQQCQCINDFTEATVLMQAMRQAGKDAICSSGQLQSLE